VRRIRSRFVSLVVNIVRGGVCSVVGDVDIIIIRSVGLRLRLSVWYDLIAYDPSIVGSGEYVTSVGG